jgi:hypothetical protein
VALVCGELRENTEFVVREKTGSEGVIEGTQAVKQDGWVYAGVQCLSKGTRPAGRDCGVVKGTALIWR